MKMEQIRQDSIRMLIAAAAMGLGLLGGSLGILEAQTLSISQIDSSPLLLSQDIELYLSLTDSEGNPIEGLSKEQFEVYESAEGKDYREVEEIEKLEAKPNKERGIHIMLLVDNSGSMYDALDGEATENSSSMRIHHAKEAIRRFINDSFNPRDVVSLAGFNTDITILSEAIKDPSALDGLLSSIERPTAEEAYTELYQSLREASKSLAGYRGRKVVVVLSDGENYPYYQHSEKPHPTYKEELLEPEEVVESYQMEGISLYAVHFGIKQDPNLGEMALQTGGNVYDARDEEELASVYRDIKEKIENEYLLRYRASMIPAERRFVKLRYESGNVGAEAERYYYAGTVFGSPLEPYPFYYLLVSLAALLLWFLLLLLRYRKLRNEAHIEVLQTAYRSKVSSSTIPLTQEKTVIGGGERADLTISGNSSVKEQHATIAYEPKSKSYTLVSEGNVTVNNRQVRGQKTLSDGDLVSIEGTTIVFDSGARTKS